MNCTCKSTVDGHPGRGPHHLAGCPLHATGYEHPPAELAETPTRGLTEEDKARLELIRDHDGNDLSENDKALLTRLAEHGWSSEGEWQNGWNRGYLAAREDVERVTYRYVLKQLRFTQPGSGEGEECEWAVGQILRHPSGSEWELVEHLDGKEHDDWRARRVRGMSLGSGGVGEERVFHREYMDRTFTVVTQPNHGTEEKPEEDFPAATCHSCRRTYDPDCTGLETLPIDWSSKVVGDRVVITCPDCGEKPVESDKFEQDERHYRRSLERASEKPVESGSGEKRWFEIAWADHHFTRTTAKNRDAAEGWATGARNSPVVSVKEVANGSGDPLPTQPVETQVAESVASRVIQLLAYDREPYTMAQVAKALAVAELGGPDSDYLAKQGEAESEEEPHASE